MTILFCFYVPEGGGEVVTLRRPKLSIVLAVCLLPHTRLEIRGSITNGGLFVQSFTIFRCARSLTADAQPLVVVRLEVGSYHQTS